MVNFTINEDLEKVNANSLLIDSGTEVASLEIGNYYLSLMCRGEVRVNLGEETFYSASEYPQIVTDYFLGKIEDLEDFWVGDNNWFQLELLKRIDDKDSLEKYEYVSNVNDYLDVADVEGFLDSSEFTKGTMLYIFMVSELKQMKDWYKEELADLDLSNL